MEYEHAPYLAPYLMWRDNEKTIRELHIKNIGQGAATNIEFSVEAKIDGIQSSFFKRNRVTFLDKSHNTKIVLTKNMEIFLKATYYDITNRKYDVDDVYYFSYDDQKREIFKQTKRSRAFSEKF